MPLDLDFIRSQFPALDSNWTYFDNAGGTQTAWAKWINPDDLRLHTEDLQPLMTDKTRVVAFTHVSNILGTLNPVKEFTAFVHRHGAMVCVDGVAYARRLIQDLGLTERKGVMRVSMVHYNTTEEVGRLIRVLETIL